MFLYRYPWRVAIEDLSEHDTDSFAVGSGACCLIPDEVPFDGPFPKRKVLIGAKWFRSYELPDTDATGRVATYTSQGHKLFTSRGAYPGLYWNDETESSDLKELVLETLRYIQRLEDIVSEKSHSSHFAFNRVDWQVALNLLAETDWADDFMRKPLIVDLAEKQQYPLKEIARGAKKILRRRREMERISKAREFDKASLIRIAQLPGRTVPEKAGPRQRIPAVKRYETSDTLENRVVEHFCTLSEAELIRNERNARSKLRGEWLKLATSFVSLCKRVKRSDDFVSIQKLKSPCLAPNFTLEQNCNYRLIWKGYQKLIKRQTEREECWAWARRLFLNRAYVYMAELFFSILSSCKIVHEPYFKHLRTRLSHQHGLWFDGQSLPGPKVIEDERQGFLTIYLLSHEDLISGFGFLKISHLNADAYLLVFGEGEVKACPIYAYVGSVETRSAMTAKRDLETVLNRIREERTCHPVCQIVRPFLVWVDFLGPDGIDDSDTAHCFHAGIPVYNDHWFSPSLSIVELLREEMFS